MLSNRQLKRSFSWWHTQMFKYEIGSLCLGTCLSHIRCVLLLATSCMGGWIHTSSGAGTPSQHSKCVSHTSVFPLSEMKWMSPAWQWQCMSPPQSHFGLSFSSCLKINVPLPFLQWCPCLGSGLRGSCWPRSLPPALRAQGQAAFAIPFIGWLLWASLWGAPIAPAAELKILPCPSLFTPAGQGRTLIWTERHFQGYGYI